MTLVHPKMGFGEIGFLRLVLDLVTCSQRKQRTHCFLSQKKCKHVYVQLVCYLIIMFISSLFA